MKRLCCATLLLTLVAVGCVTTTQEKGAKGTMWKSHTEPPPPPVTPAKVEPENADKMAQALWNEMDHQQQEEDSLVKEEAAKAMPPKK